MRLERFPITWNHVIDKESLEIKMLEQVLIEKVCQLFRNLLAPPPHVDRDAGDEAQIDDLPCEPAQRGRTAHRKDIRA